MRNHELLSRVMLHGGLDELRANAAVRAVLGAIRAQLGSTEAEALAAELPDDWAELLRTGRYSGAPLVHAVAEELRIPPGAALEQASAVCGALSDTLPQHVLDRLRRALPQESSRLLIAPEAGEPPVPPARKETLAEGRPGSHHPLSEASPARAQADSVAARNPHGDTKISSAKGLTQERESESLASAHPGSERPLSGR